LSQLGTGVCVKEERCMERGGGGDMGQREEVEREDLAASPLVFFTHNDMRKWTNDIVKRQKRGELMNSKKWLA